MPTLLLPPLPAKERLAGAVCALDVACRRANLQGRRELPAEAHGIEGLCYVRAVGNFPDRGGEG